MTRDTKLQFRATASLIGTIIGAGIFTVPYAVSRVGIVVSLAYFILLTIIVTFLHLYFGEVTESVSGKHRLPGFAEKILGRSYKHIAAVLGIFGNWLTVIVYIILGGRFLHLLLGPLFGGSEFFWGLAFTIIGFVLVIGGLAILSKIEVIITSFLLLILFIIAFICFGRFDANNVISISAADIFIPYGVILFSISGMAAIPELKDVLARAQRKTLKKVIIYGTVISSLLTALFGIAIAGVTGDLTTVDAISGLMPIFGFWAVFVGALFGFLAIISSHIVFLINQIETFRYDYKTGILVAWFLSLGVPLVVFLAGARNIIKIIGLSGGLAGGLTAILIIFMYLALLRKRNSPSWQWIVPILVALLFAVGAVVEFIISFN